MFWQIHAVRVQGQLIGVRRSQKVFRSVYRYSLPSGQSFEATSNEGSSGLKGRETGATRRLLVMPEHTGEVQEASSHLWTVVGAVFLAASIWLFHVGLTAWPSGRMTWIAAGILLLYGAIRIWRSILPAEKRLGAANFKAQRTADIANTPIIRIEDLRADPEWRANDARQRLLQTRWTPVLLLIGVILLGVGIFLGRTLVRLESGGLRARGTVESLAWSSSENHGTYHPVVSFTAESGDRVRFRDEVGSNPPSFHVGDAVTVLYLAGEPRSATIDRGWVNWLPSGLTFLFGVVLCWAAFRTPRQQLKA